MDSGRDWERLLAAERHLQHLVAGTVLVGGTAAAIHGQHRISMDGDHVLEDLRERFDEVLATLEAVSGWQTERVQRPVIILRQLNGILTAQVGNTGCKPRTLAGCSREPWGTGRLECAYSRLFPIDNALSYSIFKPPPMTGLPRKSWKSPAKPLSESCHLFRCHAG